MRPRLSAVSTFCILAGVTLGAGCSANSSPGTTADGAHASVLARHRAVSRGTIDKAARPRLDLAPPRARARSWFSRTITQGVFVADVVNGTVDIFDFKSRAQTGQIGGFGDPEGLATDSAANLYVADTLNQTIDVFAKPYSGTPTMLSDAGFYPVGVHVDAKGDVFVANICSGSGDTCLGDGNTIEYKAGSSAPTPLAGGPGRAYFVTTDKRGAVWVDGQVSSANPVPEIGYFERGGGAFVPVGIAFNFPGGITFDRAGNLLLDDQSGAPNGASILNIYPAGSTAPSGSIVLQTNGDDIVDIALGTAQARIFAPDYFSGTAGIISYPAGVARATLVPLSLGALDAVAVVPGTSP